MIHKSILTQILVFLPFLIYAQESQISLVAIQQNGQSQTFRISDYPCLTISSVNGNPTFSIRDKRNVTINDVCICIFSQLDTTDLEIKTPTNVNNQTTKKYVKNGVLYIEHNGNLYNATGQRINK